MRTVGLRELERRLRHYVQLAGSGETVLITHGDRVIAELSPPRETRLAALEDTRLARLVREGVITRPLLRRSGPPPRKPAMTFADLMLELSRSRGAR